MTTALAIALVIAVCTALYLMLALMEARKREDALLRSNLELRRAVKQNARIYRDVWTFPGTRSR